MDTPTITTKDPRVDYRALERAVAEAREDYPNAHSIKALLADGRPAVEIWPTPDRGHVRVPEWAR